MLQSRQDAEDVVQSLFTDLLRKGRDSEVDLPYLYRAATNRCLNLIRDRKRRRELLGRHDQSLRGPQRTALDEQVISLDLLARLVDRLDPRSQEILVYRCFDDLDQEEIARLLRTSRKTVGKRLARIRRELRELSEAQEERGGVA